MSVLSQRLEKPRRERVVKNPLPWYTPRFWHGMRMGTWLKNLSRNHFAISPTRLHTALSISGLVGFNSMLAAIDKAAYGKRVARTELAEPPLFILGHWRSGTTFLHELLIRDPQHTFPSTYACFVPNHFVFTEWWITPWTKKLLPNRRPMDNMAAGWARPQEDEFALGNMGVPSPYLSMMFPANGPVFPEYLDLQALSSEERDEWKSALHTFFRRIAYRDNRRIVVKSPPHTARVRTLLEMFPDAKFVHLVRDPYDLFASTVNLWKSLNEEQRMQKLGDQAWVEEYVLGSLERMYSAFTRDRPLLGEDQLYEVRYEDLAEDPRGQVEQIYQQLQLGDYSRIQPALEAHLAEVKNYRKNHYQLEESARDAVQHRWRAYFDEYGYQVE